MTTNNKREIPVICYKLNTPVVYNKGTKYETSCDTFLLCYAPHDETARNEMVDRLNALEVGEYIDKYQHDKKVDGVYFVSYQEPFDTTGN